VKHKGGEREKEIEKVDNKESKTVGENEKPGDRDNKDIKGKTERGRVRMRKVEGVREGETERGH